MDVVRKRYSCIPGPCYAVSVVTPYTRRRSWLHHVIAVQHCSPRFCHGMLSANRVHSTVEPRTTYVLAPTLSSSRMHSGTRGLNPNSTSVDVQSRSNLHHLFQSRERDDKVYNATEVCKPRKKSSALACFTQHALLRETQCTSEA